MEPDEFTTHPSSAKKPQQKSVNKKTPSRKKNPYTKYNSVARMPEKESVFITPQKNKPNRTSKVHRHSCTNSEPGTKKVRMVPTAIQSQSNPDSGPAHNCGTGHQKLNQIYQRNLQETMEDDETETNAMEKMSKGM